MTSEDQPMSVSSEDTTLTTNISHPSLTSTTTIPKNTTKPLLHTPTITTTPNNPLYPMRWSKPQVISSTEPPMIKNHTATLYKNHLYVFGGYDGKKNHSALHVLNADSFEWSTPITKGKTPQGRNGHSATLIDEQIYILGGWLGSGPLAASDLHRLNLEELRWDEPVTKGTTPGACNMHTADCIDRVIYVFRGGDGLDYLNSLHALDVDRGCWKAVVTCGRGPPARANHASAVVGTRLFIFGGWDGHKRLNDLYMLSTERLEWQLVDINGASPDPRAGMSLSNIGDKLFLFGGSGPSAMCFNDLQVYDPEQLVWTDAPLLDSVRPEACAGHSCTVVGMRLYIFGGSFGPHYFRDFHVLDADPPPEIKIREDDMQKKLHNKLQMCVNNPEFSDVCFMVEGKPFYGHKMILSMLSEKFKAMFSSGMREARGSEIEITHIRYPVFAAICNFLYTGNFEFGAGTEGQELSLEYLLEFLSVSDEFMLDSIKEQCEAHLVQYTTTENVHDMLDMAEKCNAPQLTAYCHWFLRNGSSPQHL
eukprot:CAMPEP_0115007148 /NCGR_PEP_ID=MMETSP0216-20121206/20972_1 /TAXON_ID=223996 /ORGANISM="Protocruzia adherens, Strain Boccale" /LENGTH=533 /DNA_ID=CAMNT_0002373965 /DNA_START=591 /DNA_END=2192 /DNA_ORIENTATION=-